MSHQPIQWVECPRDAMQGIKHFIPTSEKIEYIKSLLHCGFHTLDAGSFVSAKAIPQLADTQEVFEHIKNDLAGTRLLSIVANIKGAERAAEFAGTVHDIGYPLSLSETFQLRNTNRGIDQAFEDLKEIYSIAQLAGQKLVVYLSMGFGNPYGDVYDTSYLLDFSQRLIDMGVTTISLSDTVAVAQPNQVFNAFEALNKKYTGIVFGAHMHVLKGKEEPLIKAALDGGCNRFDTAMSGYGGCPMAADELAGNMGAEVLYAYLNRNNYPHTIDAKAFQVASRKAQDLFSKYEH
ncbi:MAG: hydroxymethylglutaryl-CoA lyase [Chitinophagaceae bacterium]|nr:hydroxymethylglutaryl-CoA lyase [Chitinophagaceae bacterium]